MSDFFDKRVDQVLGTSSTVQATITEWQKKNKKFLTPTVQEMIINLDPTNSIAFCVWLADCELSETETAVTFLCPTVEWAGLAQTNLEKFMGAYFKAKTIIWRGKEWRNRPDCKISQLSLVRPLQKIPEQAFHAKLEQAKASCQCYRCAKPAPKPAQTLPPYQPRMDPAPEFEDADPFAGFGNPGSYDLLEDAPPQTQTGETAP